jgi:hypothetical protein
MPPKGADDKQVKFLLTILDQVQIGQLDWDRIIKENDVPTVPAAKMRLRRLQAAFKEGASQSENAAGDEPHTPKSVKTGGSKKTSKRQVKDGSDDESPTKKTKKEQKVKTQDGTQDDDEERELFVIDASTDC